MGLANNKIQIQHVYEIVAPDISNEYAVQVLELFASCGKIGAHNESYSNVLTHILQLCSVEIAITIHLIMVELTVVKKTTVTRQKLFGNLDQDCHPQLLTVWDKGHQQAALLVQPVGYLHHHPVVSYVFMSSGMLYYDWIAMASLHM